MDVSLPHCTSTLELPLEQFLVPLSTMLPSQFITARAAARHMVRQQAGVILFVTAVPARGRQTPQPLARPLGPWNRSCAVLPRIWDLRESEWWAFVPGAW
jgi:NAD(P)-dependent dehydrogenase (short-subunit alcohol dehydrogenase family)